MEDYARPLNKRGERSAQAVGAWLRGKDYLPDQTLCSSAVRTRETLEGLDLPGQVDILDTLYHAEPATLLAELRQARGDTVAVIAHNPGIGAFAAAMVAEAPPHGRFADYPTGATLIVDFEIDDWADVAPGTGRVRNFITPRELTGE